VRGGGILPPPTNAARHGACFNARGGHPWPRRQRRHTLGGDWPARCPSLRLPRRTPATVATQRPRHPGRETDGALHEQSCRRVLGLERQSVIVLLFSELNIWPTRHRRRTSPCGSLDYALQLPQTRLTALRICTANRKSWYHDLHLAGLNCAPPAVERPLAGRRGASAR